MWVYVACIGSMRFIRIPGALNRILYSISSPSFWWRSRGPPPTLTRMRERGWEATGATGGRDQSSASRASQASQEGQEPNHQLVSSTYLAICTSPTLLVCLIEILTCSPRPLNSSLLTAPIPLNNHVTGDNDSLPLLLLLLLLWIPIPRKRCIYLYVHTAYTNIHPEMIWVWFLGKPEQS